MSFEIYDGEPWCIDFCGSDFDWNEYIVYDSRLTIDDLAEAIQKYVVIPD